LVARSWELEVGGIYDLRILKERLPLEVTGGREQTRGIHTLAVYSLTSLREGYTLDLDSWALSHEDGHLERVAVGYCTS